MRPVQIPTLASDGPLSTGPVLNVDQHNALAVADAYAAVNAISSDIASLPVHVYRNGPSGRSEVGPDALISRLLARPMPGSTSCDLFSSIMCHLLIAGNCFLAKYRGADDEIVQIGLLDPNSVWVELRGQQIIYRVWLSNQDTSEFGPEDILHITGMRGLPPNDLRGLSPVTQARLALSLNANLQESAQQFFRNGSRPSGILSIKGQQSEFTVDKIREQWNTRHAGTENLHKVAVLQGDDVTFQAVGFSAEDSQFLQNRELSAREVKRIFGIPAWRIDAEANTHRTYSNITQQNLFYVQHSLRVWLTRLERAFSNDPDLCIGGQYLEFDLDNLLRGDPDLRTTILQRALGMNGGPAWMTPAEARAAESLPPIDADELQPAALAPAVPVVAPMAADLPLEEQ